MLASEMMRRIGNGEDIEAVLDEAANDQSAAVLRVLIAEGRPDLADELQAKLREIRLGITEAQATWSAMTSAQRAIMLNVAECGRLVKDRNATFSRYSNENETCRPVYLRSINPLVRRRLLDWDQWPHCVITERGRFVVKHGAKASSER